MILGKQITVSLIPYRKNDEGTFEYYLQMRDENAPKYANQFGLFGGSIVAGEELRTSMLRETKEELEYIPRNPKFLDTFEDESRIFNVFTEEVERAFESEVHVREGKFGAFLTANEIHTSDTVATHVKPIVAQLEQSLS